MKSILIVCLCMWGLLVYGEKNNTVHLYGSLKEFKAAEVNMAPDGAAGEISDAGVIKIPVDADGNFDLVLPLSKPAYFRIGRNTLYLTPGDELKVYLGTSQPQSTFEGKGMEAKKKITKTILYILLICLALFMLVPFYWMVISSLKLNKDVFSIPMRWWPETMHPENYSTIWKKLPLLTFFKNTAKLTLCTTTIQLCTSCFAAYGFTKCHFKGRDTLFLMYVTTIAVPWQVYMVPQFILVSKMGLNDTHIGLMLMQAFSAFGVFLMRQFYISIPDELCEAARIDGLNEFGIFSKIIFPLGKPGMATLTIFTFTNVWNDFMGPLIYLKTQELKTVQLGIRMFISQYGADYAWIMAASVCSLIPVVIVFLSCQRFFVEGVAASGIKG